jgi:hypothetical protein
MKQFQLILLVAVILIPACTIPAKIELYNNSGEPITVEIDNDSLLISPNTTASFGQDYGIVFSIKTNGASFQYHVDRLALSNIEFVGWGPFTKRVFRAQFEANGFIWAVGPEQEYPVTNFIDQPEGFPVEPGKV